VKRESVKFNAKITPVKPLNDEMTLCKCYVMAVGKNRNYSCISKEAVEDALPTIYNIPVVGHMYVGEDGEYHMGGHDFEVARDENNKLIFKSVCVPYGVVPENNDMHFETIIDSMGNEATYLVSNVVLWTGRYPDLFKAVYDENLYFGQSMEIDIKSSEALKDDGRYVDIKEFAFSALCLLGKSKDKEYHVEPCFPDSRIEPYQFSVDSEFVKLMEEFKEEMKKCFHTIENQEGGQKVLTNEMINSILGAFGLKLEDLKFEITDEMTEEELKAKLKDEESADEATPDVNEEESAETLPENNFALTYKDKRNAIALACENLCKYENGNYIGYFMVDYCDKYVYMKEIFVGEQCTERYCRVEYTIDENSCVTFNGDFTTVVSQFLTLEEVDKLEKERAEYDQLKQFQIERLKADREIKYSEVIKEFSDLEGNEEFENIVKEKMTYNSAEELREKCFAIRGKTVNVEKEKKGESKISFNIEEKVEVYGGFFTKYPPHSGN